MIQICLQLHGNPKILPGGSRFGRRMMSPKRQFKRYEVANREVRFPTRRWDWVKKLIRDLIG